MRIKKLGNLEKKIEKIKKFLSSKEGRRKLNKKLEAINKFVFKLNKSLEVDSNKINETITL